MRLSTLTAEDVAHLKPGDYLEAEFEELTNPPSRFIDGWAVGGVGQPTGRTYTLGGELKEYDSYRSSQKSLGMPNGMCVRQTSGTPGGWLVRIITHTVKEEA